MKKLLSLSLIVMLALAPAMAFAQGTKGASAKAMEHASDEAIFNRVGDWFATIGKSDEEKQKILVERKAERAVKRAEKEAQKAAKEAQEKAGQAKKALNTKMKGMK